MMLKYDDCWDERSALLQRKSFGEFYQEDM